MIRLVKKEDIKYLAPIYKELYDDADIGEDWSIEKCEELLNYWYNKQGDLFFVAIEDGKPVGAIVSGIKSWFDGLRLVDGEIFVSKEYQEKYIGKQLMIEHLKQAKIKYNAKVMEFHTYGDETEFPQNWYNRIGFKKDNELIIMNGEIEEVLDKLGYDHKDGFDETSIITNYSYDELSNLYENLTEGDKAYIFDILPDYAYLDNENERRYIESRITAMKNNADISLFILGSKDKFKDLESNELFKYTLDSCYNKGKIYLLDSEELKTKCPVEFFQLAQGLYFGERKDGSKESFRDLWVNSDSIGLFIKDMSINNYLETCIEKIVEMINDNKIDCIKKITK